MQTELISVADYSRLLGDLYSGAEEEMPWRGFLRSLKGILNLQDCFLFLRPPGHDDGGLMFSSGVIEAVTPDNPSNSYTEQFYAADPLVNLQPGQVVALSDLVSDADLVASDLYQLCMKPSDVHYTLGVDFEYGNKERFSIRLARRLQEGDFTSPERDFIALLAEHIERAVCTAQKQMQLDGVQQMWVGSFSARAIGVVMLDKMGCILRCNSLAEQFLNEKDGLSRLHQRLHLKSSELNLQLKTYIDEALETQRQAKVVSVNALSVPRTSGRRVYELVIKPVPLQPLMESRSSPHLNVFIFSQEGGVEVNMRLLMKLYRLTATEASVAIKLAQGSTLDEVVESMNISRNTARTHLRAIFSKTGTNQQSVLVSLVLNSLASQS